MNQTEKNLDLLAIFHYIVATLMGLFSFFPLIYVVLGGVFLANPDNMFPHGANEPSPEMIGTIFLIVGLVMTGLGFLMAVLVAYSGYNLSKHKRHTFCIVIAALTCLFCVPFGTILGIFTIITLTKPEAKALFAQNSPALPTS